MIDPFGGITGKEITNTSGFLVDKEEAIKAVYVSIDILENKNIKKPTFLETLRSKKSKTLFGSKVFSKLLNSKIVLSKKSFL